MITDGAIRRVACGGIAAGLVIGLAACGSAVAGSSGAAKPAGAAQPAAARSAASGVNPGGPGAPTAMPKRLLLCVEIPGLTHGSVTWAPLPPYRAARAEVPAAFTARNAAMVRGVPTMLCARPAAWSHRFCCPFRELSPLP